MQKTLIIILLFCFYQSKSQDWKFEKPNYKKIEKSISNKKSELYYPNLMTRYLQYDSTFTLEEKRHLYYGYSFDARYSPYSKSDYNDSLTSLIRTANGGELDFKQVIEFTDSILVKEPLDLRALGYRRFVFMKANDEQNTKNISTKMNNIIEALFSSGNGISKESAFYVIYTSHEYELLNITGLGFGGEQSLTGNYDYLTLAENDGGIEGLFFEISPCLNFLSKMFKK